MKHPIYTEFNLDAKVGVSKLIAVTHTDDRNADVLEVNVRQNGAHIDLTGATVFARMVLHKDRDYLLSDNVPCTVSDSGNIMIPFDNAVVKTLQGIVKIEVSITRGEDKLTLQFPLWVSVRGSIIESAEVTPESEGTIPDLLKEAADALEDATEALERLGSYSNLEDKPQINGVTLDDDQSADDLGLQKKLTAGQNITIENDGTISASDGVTSYNDLTDKPMFNNSDIAGKYISDRLYIEDVGNKKRINLQNIQLNDLYPTDRNRIMTLILNNTQYNLNNILEAAQIIDINNPISGYSNLPINSKGLLFCVNNYTQIYVTYRENLTDKTRIFIRQKTDFTSSWSLWQELTGGSQIVSGVVNQNGTITFTVSDGNTFTTSGASVIGPQGAPGDDYVLTPQDKTDIANIVLQALPTTQGVLYGNTSN